MSYKKRNIVQFLFYNHMHQTVYPCHISPQVLPEPLTVRFAGGYFSLNFFILDNAAFFNIDEKHAAGPQPSLGSYILRLHVQYAGLRSHNDNTVPGDGVTRRPQPVAVQDAEAELPLTDLRSPLCHIPESSQKTCNAESAKTAGPSGRR